MKYVFVCLGLMLLLVSCEYAPVDENHEIVMDLLSQKQSEDAHVHTFELFRRGGYQKESGQIYFPDIDGIYKRHIYDGKELIRHNYEYVQARNQYYVDGMVPSWSIDELKLEVRDIARKRLKDADAKDRILVATNISNGGNCYEYGVQGITLCFSSSNKLMYADIWLGSELTSTLWEAHNTTKSDGSYVVMHLPEQMTRKDIAELYVKLDLLDAKVIGREKQKECKSQDCKDFLEELMGDSEDHYIGESRIHQYVENGTYFVNSPKRSSYITDPDLLYIPIQRRYHFIVNNTRINYSEAYSIDLYKDDPLYVQEYQIKNDLLQKLDVTVRDITRVDGKEGQNCYTLRPLQKRFLFEDVLDCTYCFEETLESVMCPIEKFSHQSGTYDEPQFASWSKVDEYYPYVRGTSLRPGYYNDGTPVK